MTIDQDNSRAACYRVWIAAYRNWRPESYRDVPPPEAVALEPAETGTMSARQAARYVEAFNRASLARRAETWAFAIRVAVRYDGEPRPGRSLAEAGIGCPPPAG